MPSPGGLPVVVARDLRRSFRTRQGVLRPRRTTVEAVKGVSLEIAPSELTELLVGLAYLAVKMAAMRLFEQLSRRGATLDSV